MSIPDSDTVLQKVVFMPLLHRLFPVPDPGNGRCRDCATAVQGLGSLKQGTNKVKTKCESDPNRLFVFFVDFETKNSFQIGEECTVSVRVIHGECTNAVPRVYGEATAKVPKSY